MVLRLGEIVPNLSPTLIANSTNNKPMNTLTHRWLCKLRGMICLFILSISTAFGIKWDVETINGIRYVPMRDVRSFYGITRENNHGRGKVYEIPGEKKIQMQENSQDVYMNGLKFVFSYPIRSSSTKGLMVSTMDLHKILNPVLRPSYISNKRPVNTIILDPGHGGHDSGARNRISREADLNLIVAKKLAKKLKALNFNVILTRDTDQFLTLQERVDIANQYKSALFISIHFNSGGRSARGVETFTLAPAGTSSTMSHNVRNDALQGNAQDSMNIALATAVQAELLRGSAAKKAGYQMVDRGIKRARYSVLCTIKHPAILVEGGFMSHPQEAVLVASDKYQNFMADALCLAVQRYRRSLNAKTANNIGQPRRNTQKSR